MQICCLPCYTSLDNAVSAEMGTETSMSYELLKQGGYELILIRECVRDYKRCAQVTIKGENEVLKWRVRVLKMRVSLYELLKKGGTRVFV